MVQKQKEQLLNEELIFSFPTCVVLRPIRYYRATLVFRLEQIGT